MPPPMQAHDQGRILLAGDGPHFIKWAAGVLANSGYETRIAVDAETALKIASAWAPDLIVCDLHIAGINAAEMCRHVRAQSNLAVVAVSANASTRERIEVLDSGADDFLMLPVPPDELRARIRALLRRSRLRPADADPAVPHGDFVLLGRSRRVLVRGREVRLTRKEFALLMFLLQNSWRLLPYEQIHMAVWGPAQNTARERVRDLVAQLRQKIESNPNQPAYIITEHGVGYQFQATMPGDTPPANPAYDQIASA